MLAQGLDDCKRAAPGWQPGRSSPSATTCDIEHEAQGESIGRMADVCVYALLCLWWITRLDGGSGVHAQMPGRPEDDPQENNVNSGISNLASFQPPFQQGSTLATPQGCKTAAGFDSQAGRAVRLTPRELEVLALLCEGLPNKLISRRLDISSATVKCHISRILSELGVASRLQAVVAAARCGLIGDGSLTGSEASLPAVGHVHAAGLQGSVRSGTTTARL
jgi:DNA-binding CsgD family transcriptional regulator